MSVVDAFQDDTDQAVGLMTRAPAAPAPAAEKASLWRGIPSALASAVPAAAAEGLATVAEAGAVVIRAADRMRRAPNAKALDAARAEPVSGETEVSRSLRNVADGYRPDPLTAGAAEQIVFGVAKGLTKAVGYTLATGNPLAGAAAFGVDEGAAMLDDLQRQGVDDKTATQAAVLTGLATGPSILLPGAGSTLAKTAALTAAGGPGLFVAQQAMTRDILAQANYGAISERFDPLDPLGLAVATLIPAAFGGYHAAKLVRGAKSKPVEAIAPAEVPGQPPEASAAPTPADTVDAAMVHNLTLQQDRAAAEPVVPPVIEAPRRPPEAATEGGTASTEPGTMPLPEGSLADEADPMAALRERTAPLEQSNPEAATELQRVRQEAEQGTDAELGRVDAELLRVAAECSLTA